MITKETSFFALIKKNPNCDKNAIEVNIFNLNPCVCVGEERIDIEVLLLNGKRVNISINPLNTINQLKKIIENQFGYPKCHQLLIFNSRRLFENDYSLNKYGINNRSRLELLSNHTGGGCIPTHRFKIYRAAKEELSKKIYKIDLGKKLKILFEELAKDYNISEKEIILVSRDKSYGYESIDCTVDFDTFYSENGQNEIVVMQVKSDLVNPLKSSLGILIMRQQVDGRWEHTQELFQILKRKNLVTSEQLSKLQNSNNKDLAMTKLVLIVLNTFFGLDKAKWKMIAKKATIYIKRHKNRENDSNDEKNDSNEENSLNGVFKSFSSLFK